MRGTCSYRVWGELGSDGLAAECTCPLREDGEFCKHAVATVLEWLVLAGGTSLKAEAPGDTPGARTPRVAEVRKAVSARGRRRVDLAAFLAAQPTEWLVQRLLRVAKRDATVRSEWETPASRSGAGGVDLAGFRRQLRTTLSVSGRFDWDDTYDYQTSAEELLDSIDAFIDAGLAPEAVELAEEALQLISVAVEIVIGKARP